MVYVFYIDIIFIFEIIYTVWYCILYVELLTLIDYAALLLGKIFLYFPIYVTVGIHAAISVTYYLYLLQLIHILKQKDEIIIDQDYDHQHDKNKIIPSKDIFDLYRKLYESFCVMNTKCLKKCINYCSLACFVHLWIASYHMFEDDDMTLDQHLIYNLIIFCLFVIYVISASVLSETYYRFESLLWKYGYQIMDNSDGDRGEDENNHMYTNNELQQFNYLLQYVYKHPITVKIGQLTVTKRNFMRFLVAVVIAKLMSYSVKWIVN